MSDRAPRNRPDTDGESTRTHKGEARRFLGTPMQNAMIRGLGDDEDRARAYLAVANEYRQDSKIGPSTVEKIAAKVREAKE